MSSSALTPANPSYGLPLKIPSLIKDEITPDCDKKNPTNPIVIIKMITQLRLINEDIEFESIKVRKRTAKTEK